MVRLCAIEKLTNYIRRGIDAKFMIDQSGESLSDY
jgi:hypothetical protein